MQWSMATEEVVEGDASLIALTTHFAQVQFRLKQIISAEPEHKEELLKDLEKFAFQGCGKPMTYDTAASGENSSTEAQRQIRVELMEKLRHQLDDIERCAKEATSVSVASESHDQATPTTRAQDEGSVMLDAMAEKQRIIIEELRKRFDFQFGDLERLSTEEVKRSVGKAVREVVDPIKSKEEYVSHLQGQIKDLERYIGFLQAKQVSTPDSECLTTPHDSTSHNSVSHDSMLGSCDSIKSPLKLHPKPSLSLKGQLSKQAGVMEQWEGLQNDPPTPQYRLSMTQLDGVECAIDARRCEWEKMDSLGRSLGGHQGRDDLRLSLFVMRKTLAVMQVLTLCQCGGNVRCLPKYVTDGKRKRYHMALQSLEMAVDKISIITTAIREEGLPMHSRVSLETDLHETVSMVLADSLRVLVEHGLLANGQPVSFSDGCLPVWKNWSFSVHGLGGLDLDCAAWKVFMHFYKMKRGDKFSARTDQLLSSSFLLDANSTSVKKSLLSSINKVTLSNPGSYHTSRDTKFRALICEGFNTCHLAEWFKLLASNPSIGEELYTAASFLTTTGFRPAIACLERLKDNPSCEPVSLPQNYYQAEEAFLRS